MNWINLSGGDYGALVPNGLVLQSSYADDDGNAIALVHIPCTENQAQKFLDDNKCEPDDGDTIESEDENA